MTGAELKCLRESLGLTVRALCARLELKHERTVERWESGHVPVPDDVAAHVRRLDAAISRMADQAVETAKGAADVVMLRYRESDFLGRMDAKTIATLGTAAVHAAAIERARRAMAVAGINARLTWFDANDYDSWRDGRTDTTARRAEWASRQVRSDIL